MKKIKLNNKVYIVLSLIFISVFLQSCCRIRVIQTETYFFFQGLKRNPYSTIDFGGFFTNDTVSFYINDSCIFRNAILESPKNTGGGMPTDYCFKIKRNCSSYIIIKTCNSLIFNDKKLNIKGKKICMKTNINNKEQLFNINLRKGKYIEFYKYQDSISVLQKKLPIKYI